MTSLSRNILACLLLSITVNPLSAETLPELVEAMKASKVVGPPKSVAEVQWLIGKWDCVARALRRPPRRDDLYAFLGGLEFDEGGILPSRAFPGGVRMRPVCKFLADGRGQLDWEDGISIEFHEKGFFFGMPAADLLKIAKDPNPNAQWFILEHSDTGDVLMFKRRVEKSSAPTR